MCALLPVSRKLRASKVIGKTVAIHHAACAFLHAAQQSLPRLKDSERQPEKKKKPSGNEPEWR